MMFSERYDDEILATAYRVSTRILGGESFLKIAESLRLIGWYPAEVGKILYKAKIMAYRGNG
jgi:hypothetical protein